MHTDSELPVLTGCDWSAISPGRWRCSRCGQTKRRPFARVCPAAQPAAAAGCRHLGSLLHVIAGDWISCRCTQQIALYACRAGGDTATPCVLRELPAEIAADLRSIEGYGWAGRCCAACPDRVAEVARLQAASAFT